MIFARSTLEVFAKTLAQVRLDPLDPDLLAQAQVLVTAREELEAAFKELPVVLPVSIGDADLEPS